MVLDGAEGGFTLEEDHYHLVFDDPRYDGLRVTIREMSVDEALDFDDAFLTRPTSRAQARKQQEDLAERLAAILVDWNLRDRGGQPVPMTARGILGQNQKLMGAVIKASLDAITGVAVPLDSNSNGGGSSGLEVSMPMEPLSPSPGS